LGRCGDLCGGCPRPGMVCLTIHGVWARLPGRLIYCGDAPRGLRNRVGRVHGDSPQGQWPVCTSAVGGPRCADGVGCGNPHDDAHPTIDTKGVVVGGSGAAPWVLRGGSVLRRSVLPAGSGGACSRGGHRTTRWAGQGIGACGARLVAESD
jgi:hypothetical protein